ncbi:MAG: hypothetical protein NTZ67_06470 [Gammaproteobacteria bacterium]|nr:hypothetical protein [Gammaproteobacteria bacterium]
MSRESHPVADKKPVEASPTEKQKLSLLKSYKVRCDQLELPWGDIKTVESDFMKALLVSFKNRHEEFQKLVASSASETNADSVAALTEKLNNSYRACLDVERSFYNAYEEIIETKACFSEKQHAHTIEYKKIYEATRKLARYDAKNPEHKLIYQNLEKSYNANMIFESILMETDKIVSVNDFQNKLDAQNNVCMQLLELLNAQVKTPNDPKIKNIAPARSIEDFAEFENGAKCPGLTITPPSPTPTPSNITPEAKTDAGRTPEQYSPTRSSSNHLFGFHQPQERQSVLRMAQQSRKKQSPTPSN